MILDCLWIFYFSVLYRRERRPYAGDERCHLREKWSPTYICCEDPFRGIPKKGDLSGIYGYDVNYREVKYEVV